MRIQDITIGELKPYKLNAKKHPKSQIEGLAESIRRFGFTQPIVVDGANTIVIGHGRVEAAKLAGLESVPAILREDLSPAEIRALRIIDNRIAETGWDLELLALDLEELEFDLAPFNLNLNKLDLKLEPCEGLRDENEIPEPPQKAKTKPGELWALGKHRLLCGNATKTEDVVKLLDGVEPSLMVTDPPYGVSYDPKWRIGHDKGTGKRANGKVKNDDKADWTEAFALFPGDVAYVWHAALFTGVSFNALEACGFNLRSQIIWAKQHFALSRGNYHWQHEPCWYAVKKGKNGHWSGNRKQSTLWSIANRNPFGGKKEDASTKHSTQKPVECMRRPIENHTNRGQAVYDPFLGSGTTLIAAEQTGRVCYGLEIDPKYCDVIIERWENFTGEQAKRI